MILSATKYGLFVELGDLFVEGLVPIQTLGALDNDYYTFRENTREIIGERWGRRFRIGQRVRVLLDRIDAAQKRLQFVIIEDEAQGTDAGAPPLRRKQADGWEKKKPSSPKSKPNNKSKSRAAKPSMQRQAPKPHPFPKKKKTKHRN